MGSDNRESSPGSNKPQLAITADYTRWRAMIFMIRPEQVEVSKDEAHRVYGVIMDIGMIDRQSSAHWAMSLTAFPTGEASFHPTPGGAVIGLGNNSRVGQAAKEIVEISQKLLPIATAARDHPLPEPGYVQFFFLTTSGVRVVKDHLDRMQQPGGAFAPLLTRFGFIRQFADQILQQKHADKSKAGGE